MPSTATPEKRAEQAAPPAGGLAAALHALGESGLPYVVGGGHAMTYHGGLPPAACDSLELFVRADDHRRALNTLAHAGYRTEYVDPAWCAVASAGAQRLALAYGSANHECEVDDDWFKHAVTTDVLGHPAHMCPAEELLWSKAFVMERRRFDGADVAHLILRQGPRLDWQRLLRRFHGHERVLLAHCVLFGYAYPTDVANVPDWVLDYLQAAARHEPMPTAKLCRGTLLSPGDYAVDLSDWGYADARDAATPGPGPAPA